MQIILTTLAVGIIAGYFLRHKNLKHLDSITVGIVWLLLFLLGVAAGSDDRVVGWIGSLGVEAIIISIGGVAGSSLFAMLLWKFAGCKEKEKGGENER